MRKLYLVLLFLSAGASLLNAQDYWIQLDSVKGSPRSVASAFVANGEGFIVAGLESPGFTRRMYSYDLMQDDWDDEQSIGGLNGGGLSRGSACGFSIGGKGYICLGQGDNTNFLRDVWEYDPLLDVWSQKADYAGSARRGAVAFVISDIAYVGTGEDITGLRKDFYKFDPQTNLWGNVMDFGGTPRRQAVGFSIGNQGYVGTGDDGTLRNDFWQYQVFQNAWVQKASFPGTPRSGATGWGIFPDGYIATGEDAGWNYCNDIWAYNYFTNQWVQRTSMPGTGRKHAISFVVGNVAYVGTGYNGDLLDDFYSYQGITGVNEHASASAALQVFPLPASGPFNLHTANRPVSGDELHVYDVNGREVTSYFSIAMDSNGYTLIPADHVSGNFTCVLLNAESELIGTAAAVVVKN